MTKTLNQLKALVLSGAIVLTTQAVNLMRGGNSLDVMNAIVGMIVIIAICIISLKIKEALPLKIPAFAWASLLGTLVTTPWFPGRSRSWASPARFPPARWVPSSWRWPASPSAPSWTTSSA